jgi:CDP-4-dehydro-6-deoxyglucose reductase
VSPLQSRAEIISIEPRRLASEPPINLLTLNAPGFQFEAGQYLNVLLNDGARLPLSIASAPECLPEVRLHYRSTAGLFDAEQMDRLLERATELPIEGPDGDVCLDPDDTRPLTLISGGTGSAQAVGLASAQASRHPDAPVLHLACADHEDDFYFRDLIPASRSYRSVLIADPDRSDRNRGLAWLKANAAALGGADLKAGRIVISGGPPFVYAVSDTLTGLGIEPGRLASDVYAWAPR